MNTGLGSITIRWRPSRAGVSKLSLYRRWNSKLAITAEVFRHLRETSPFEDQGSLEADIRFLLKPSIGSRDTKSTAKILLRTMGEISGNSELMAPYTKHILSPRMEQMRALLERARLRRELRSALPVDLASAMIAGRSSCIIWFSLSRPKSICQMTWPVSSLARF